MSLSGLTAHLSWRKKVELRKAENLIVPIMTSLPHPVVRWNIFPESSGLLRSLQERGDNANITETSEVYDDVSYYNS